MDKFPCYKCIVRPCCSEVCESYCKYLYKVHECFKYGSDGVFFDSIPEGFKVLFRALQDDRYCMSFNYKLDVMTISRKETDRGEWEVIVKNLRHRIISNEDIGETLIKWLR